MNDPRLFNFANNIVAYSLDARPGDWVAISSHVAALPLIHEIARCILRAGGRFSLSLEDDALREIVLTESGEEQLKWLPPIDLQAMEQADAFIALRAADNTRALSGVDPSRQRARQAAFDPLNQALLRRSAAGELRWMYTEFPCAAFAQDADMSLRAYEGFVFAATYADQPDGVSRCREAFGRDDRYAARLNGHKAVSLRGPNIDLRLSIEGRTFVNSAGRHNLPDGEIYTGPVEHSVEGWARFTFPAIYGGREVDGVEMTFEEGRVAKAKAAKNEAFLLEVLNADAGARYLGEFGIGTNYQIQRFTRRILYDEKIGGTIHLAIGNGYPETGSRNTSGAHWDFICDMREDSEMIVDGEVVYKNGVFCV